MKLRTFRNPDSNQESRHAIFNDRLGAFASSSLLVAGLALGFTLPNAQDGTCTKKSGIETVTTYGPGATVREGDVVGKIAFGFSESATVSWKVAGIDSNGVKLAYEMKAPSVYEVDTAGLCDTVTVAYGQDTTVSAHGKDAIRIIVKKGADPASVAVTTSFVR